jgi:hypothetical protein
MMLLDRVESCENVQLGHDKQINIAIRFVEWYAPQIYIALQYIYIFSCSNTHKNRISQMFVGGRVKFIINFNTTINMQRDAYTPSHVSLLLVCFDTSQLFCLEITHCYILMLVTKLLFNYIYLYIYVCAGFRKKVKHMNITCALSTNNWET